MLELRFLLQKDSRSGPGKQSPNDGRHRRKTMHLHHDPQPADGPQAEGPQSNSRTARYIVKS